MGPHKTFKEYPPPLDGTVICAGNSEGAGWFYWNTEFQSWCIASTGKIMKNELWRWWPEEIYSAKKESN